MATEAVTDTVLKLPPRSSKPRRRGITSMADCGPDQLGWTGGERGIRDLLDVAGNYIDFAKIVMMNALLIPADVVKRTSRLYRDAGITPFAGGILFEYAWQRGQVAELIRHLKAIEVPGLEISENYITLTDDERRRAIERFKREELHVVYEFGRKNPEQPLNIDYLGRIVNDVAQQGIPHVTIEQSEFDLLAQTPDALQALARESWFEHLLIEADPFRFPQQHVQLLRDFGPEVNLANIASGQVLRLEGLRRGIGRAVNYSLLSGDASHPAGATVPILGA